MLARGNQSRIHKRLSEDKFINTQKTIVPTYQIHSIHVLEGSASHAGRIEERTETLLHSHFQAEIETFLLE